MKRVIIASKSINMNPRSVEYDMYLNTHITGVRRSWNEVLRPAILKNLDEVECTVEDMGRADLVIPEHDKSKYIQDEYRPYLNYFYPSKGAGKDEAAFDKAWLLHQHRNPHHHQYWVLMRDSGEKQPIDMPFEYVCEMLCDWHSFTLRDPESTAKAWWKSNKKNMVLSDNTIKLIDSMIDYMDTPLTQEVQL